MSHDRSGPVVGAGSAGLRAAGPGGPVSDYRVNGAAMRVAFLSLHQFWASPATIPDVTCDRSTSRAITSFNALVFAGKAACAP